MSIVINRIIENGIGVPFKKEKHLDIVTHVWVRKDGWVLASTDADVEFARKHFPEESWACELTVGPLQKGHLQEG